MRGGRLITHSPQLKREPLRYPSIYPLQYTTLHYTTYNRIPTILYYILNSTTVYNISKALKYKDVAKNYGFRFLIWTIQFVSKILSDLLCCYILWNVYCTICVTYDLIHQRRNYFLKAGKFFKRLYCKIIRLRFIAIS